ncbi:MAG: methyltransferase domain-containing protein [Elusimicrobia bacterium]|nr:methyltransferase domain-containing protein [Elusimicrobiota bacterium]
MTAPRLPYFDLLFEGRAAGRPASAVLSRFVHWGYWEEPRLADGTAEDLAAAMERLNAEVLKEARLADGQSVLDAGCGFGGTLACVNRAYEGMRLAGLNIDARQLEVARESLSARASNELRWVEGDACALPFPDASFDRVLAVECIFHFPSRARFLAEVSRVLRPGGRLSLSDFVPPDPGGRPSRLGTWLGRQVEAGYGDLGDGWPDGDYAAMAGAAGLRLAADRDVTRNTLPTYPALLSLLRGERGEGARRLRWATRVLQGLSRLGAVRYRVVAFEKPL